MSLEHAHARVSAFLEAFCANTAPIAPDGDTDAVSYLDQHVLTATDIRTLLDATAPIMPGTVAERFDRLEPWAQRELRTALAIRSEAHAEAAAAVSAPGQDTVFWRGPGQERHYLPNGSPVTFIISGAPSHEVRVQTISDCVMVTTPSPARTLAVTPMSHRALCIAADLNPTPPSEAEGHSVT